MGTPYNQDTGIPTKFTEWASDGLNILEPAESKKDLGWVVDDVPGSNVENYLKRNIYRWEKYFHRLFENVIQAGVWVPPENIGVTGGSGGTMPTFVIDAFMVTSATGKRLPFVGGTYTPTGLSNETVAAHRLDGVYWKLDETLNEWEWVYIEDINGAGAGSITTEHHLICMVYVQNDAVNYELATPTDQAIVRPPKISMEKNHIFISGAYNDTVGENAVGILGIQEAIDVLARRQGGVVEVVGNWLGKWDWELIEKIQVKSGVMLKTESGALITSFYSTDTQTLHDTFFEMLGYSGTAYFVDSVHIQDNVNASLDFLDYGILSLIEIISGPNAGYYFIKDLLNVAGDPAAQFRKAKLLDLNMEVVVFTPAISAPYKIWIFEGGIEGFNIQASKSLPPIPLDEYLISAGFTWNCSIARNKLEADRATDLEAGIDCTPGDHHGLKLEGNSVNGTFADGIIADVANSNEKCKILNNQVDVSGAAGVISNGIDFQSSGAGDNLVGGNQVVVKGAGVTEAYSGTAGWKGYPATEEHNENGTHKDEVIGNDQLKAEVAGDGLSGGAGSPLAVVPDGVTLEIATAKVQVKNGGITKPKMAVDSVDEHKIDSTALGFGLTGGSGTKLSVVVGYGISLLACISSKDDASAASTISIRYQKGTVVYDGTGAFTWDHFSSWHIRRDAAGRYQIGIPGTVDGSDVMTPNLLSGEFLIQAFPLTLAGVTRIEYVENAGAPFTWTYFKLYMDDMAGAALNNAFELVIETVATP